MERVYYIRAALRREMLFTIFGLTILTLGLEGMAVFSPTARRGATLFGCFPGALLVACVIAWCQERRYRLTLDANRVSSRGMRRQTELFLNDISRINWPQLAGAVKLNGPAGTKKRIAVPLKRFERSEQLEIIRFLRKNIPEPLQQNWPLFCHCTGIRLRDFPPDREPGPGEIRLTRRRMSAWALLLFLACIPIGVAGWWMTGRLPFLAVPLGTLPIGLMLRFIVPKSGAIAPRMFADWRTTRFLLGMFAVVPVMLCWFALRGRDALLTWPDYVFIAFAFAGMFTMMYLLDRQERREREPRVVESVRNWEAGEVTQ